MQLITLAVAASSLLGSSLAAPLESRATEQFSVTQWTFTRGSDAYDYSFTVSGTQSGHIPHFVATCEGQTQQGGYVQCSLMAPGPQKTIPDIYAKVKVVTSSSDPNDSVPKVTIKEEYEQNGCEYAVVGKAEAKANSNPNSKAGNSFNITPSISSVC